MSGVPPSSRIQVALPLGTGPDKTNADLPFGSSAILGSLVASEGACAGVAEEARTRGFAARLSPGGLLSRCDATLGPWTRAVKQVPGPLDPGHEPREGANERTA